MASSNLLFVITKLELGGAQRQLLDLISHLEQERYKPFLFTAREGLLLSEALSINGLTVYRSRFLEWPINPIKDLLALFEIYAFIKKNKIDIVHTHSSKAGILGRWAARLSKVKIIFHTVHGWSFNDYQPFIVRKFFIFLEKFSAGFTYRLITVSAHDKDKGLRNGIGKAEKYATIHCGIDYSKFGYTDPSLRRGFGIDGGDLVVGMISCLKPQKAPCDFIKLAFMVSQEIPQVKFLLVGDGTLRSPISRLIRKLKLEKKIILTGWRRDIPQILSMLDVFMITSLWEGLPVSVLEAMASGRAVLATDTGGINELIRDGENGFLCVPGDLKTMSRKLQLLLQDARLRRELGERAKKTLNSDFSLRAMVENNQILYAKALTECRPLARFA